MAESWEHFDLSMAGIISLLCPRSGLQRFHPSPLLRISSSTWYFALKIVEWNSVPFHFGCLSISSNKCFPTCFSKSTSLRIDTSNSLRCIATNQWTLNLKLIITYTAPRIDILNHLLPVLPIAIYILEPLDECIHSIVVPSLTALGFLLM